MIRVLLVDDEEPARHRLRGLLAEYEDLLVVDEAGDGDEAMRKIDQLRPDLVFLDIQMPGSSGMEVAASLQPPRPHVIFCTAFDQYAIDAFEHHATDYLLKPVNRQRLARAIEKVRAQQGRAAAERELDEAGRTQARLLPQELPTMKSIEFAGLCRAARGVGGDYYDFLGLGRGQLGLAVADVSGKGLFAGLLVAGLQSRIQAIAPRHGSDVGPLAAEANRVLHASLESNRYATFFYAHYDDTNRILRYVNAGHLPPLVLRHAGAADESVLRLKANGTVIGLIPDGRYETTSVQLRPGDILVAYTDGVTEAFDSNGAEFGERRLLCSLREHASLPAQALCAALQADVDRFVGRASVHDDSTLVVARIAADASR